MTSALPETSAPSPGAFAETYTQAADEGCSSVICLTLSAGLSSTYQAACAGAEEVQGQIEVRVVDTRTVTLGQALVVLEAAKVAAVTSDLAATEAATRAVVPRIRVFGALDTMDNVRKGGRDRNSEGPPRVAPVDQADHRDPGRSRRSRVASADGGPDRSSTSPTSSSKPGSWKALQWHTLQHPTSMCSWTC